MGFLGINIYQDLSSMTCFYSKHVWNIEHSWTFYIWMSPRLRDTIRQKIQMWPSKLTTISLLQDWDWCCWEILGVLLRCPKNWDIMGYQNWQVETASVRAIPVSKVNVPAPFGCSFQWPWWANVRLLNGTISLFGIIYWIIIYGIIRNHVFEKSNGVLWDAPESTWPQGGKISLPRKHPVNSRLFRIPRASRPTQQYV